MLFWPSTTFLSAHGLSTISHDIEIFTQCPNVTREAFQPHVYCRETPESPISHLGTDVMPLRSPSVEHAKLSPLLVTHTPHSSEPDNLVLSADKVVRVQEAPNSKWLCTSATLTRSMSLSSDSANTAQRTRRSTSLPCTMLTYCSLDVDGVADIHGVEYSLDDGEVTMAPSSLPYVVEKPDFVLDAPTRHMISLQVDEEDGSALDASEQVDGMDEDCAGQEAMERPPARMDADTSDVADSTDESLQLTDPTLLPFHALNTEIGSCAQTKLASALNLGKRRREESQARSSEITRVLKKPFVSPLRPTAWLDNLVPTPIASAPETPTAVEIEPVLYQQPRVMTRRLAKPFKPPHSVTKSAQSNMTIRTLEDRVRLLRQAVRFHTQPDEDARLEELIVKWRVAGREIVERLFSCVPKPEDNGVPQWQGYNPLPLDRSTDAIMTPADDIDAEQSKDEESEATAAPSWSCGTMMMQIGVDPALLGWNEDEEDWLD